MEAAVQGYNPDGLLLPRLGHDGLPTHRAARRVLPVKVLYAVYLRRGVHCEGHAVQTAVTNDTREAARVVGFPHGSQDAVQNGFGALWAAL